MWSKARFGAETWGGFECQIRSGWDLPWFLTLQLPPQHTHHLQELWRGWDPKWAPSLRQRQGVRLRHENGDSYSLQFSLTLWQKASAPEKWTMVGGEIGCLCTLPWVSKARVPPMKFDSLPNQRRNPSLGSPNQCTGLPLCFSVCLLNVNRESRITKPLRKTSNLKDCAKPPWNKQTRRTILNILRKIKYTSYDIGTGCSFLKGLMETKTW